MTGAALTANTPKRLLLMRHAKSDWSDGSVSDHDRPLNARGQDAAPRIASWLASEGMVPEVILCSTAVRTSQTLALMLNVWRNNPVVVDSEPEVLQKKRDTWHYFMNCRCRYHFYISKTRVYAPKYSSIYPYLQVSLFYSVLLHIFV